VEEITHDKHEDSGAHELIFVQPKGVPAMIAFGPVPSRRLGRSLGINNIPAKYCSYSCAYCQVGRTPRRRIERSQFFKPEQIVREVGTHVEKLRKAGEIVDYLTFVPNGEATLDINLGSEIRALTRLGIKIAVITNSSLLWREDVREDLAQADWISLKIDVAEEKTWRKLNRPHRALSMTTLLQGIFQFAKSFTGDLVTETMLVRGINDDASSLQKVSEILSQVNPRCCYLAAPIRPPAESWVQPPSADILSEINTFLDSRIPGATPLTWVDEGPFTPTGSAEQDLLDITAVHPMEEGSLEKFLQKAGAEWTLIERLLEGGRLTKSQFGGKSFYRRA
jgi:wyosine [tRNA(Phe)-imidazoG37] synthetase (radical SAM superfamily)